MKRSVKIALASAVPVLAAAQFYDYVFARQEPQLIHALKSRKPSSLHKSAYYQWRDAATAEARAKPHTVLTLRSERGHTLRGHLWQAGPVPAKTVAFLVHGYRSCAQETVGPFLSYYHSRGIDVFACDHEAAGESEGRYFSYDYYESRCCLQWLDAMISRYGSSVQILLHGFSMGASTVLHMSDRCPSQVKFLVSDCGYTSGRDILVYQTGNRKLLYALLRGINRLAAGFDLEETDVRPHLARTDKPILFVHGTADPTVPYWMGQTLYDRCPTPKAMLTVQDGFHVESFFRARSEYEEKLDDFLRRYLTQ